MPLEEYNQLDIDYTHRAGSHYESTNAFIKQPMRCARKDKNQWIGPESVCGNGCTVWQFVIAIPIMKCFEEESIVCIISLLHMG